MAHVLATLIDDQVWALERPVWFSGVRLHARTTVVRLADGGLLIHSPAPPSEALRTALAAIGPVRWLVVPNCFHHLGTPPTAAAFPDAKVVGPASARARNEALRIDLDLGDEQLARVLPELEVLPLHGVPFLDETLLYHRPSRTLLGADVALTASARDHWTWRWAGRVTGCYGRMRVPPDVRRKIVDRAATARSLRAVLDCPAERLLVAHAEPFGADWREQLAAAWRVEGVAV
ncbi:MAG: DUF4336 domain-containing protein [Kofleriaceae bacterium]|jgi:hypothetical protein|nr:DUF4336 domain-containing protein [Kofleriaceae bacterium]MBP6835658.1 DUF4336 domain-containing protein [Kofleriaceae bacterium]MBP9208117.1 DUF4336 domain-containing protein [Kofleriaceae bacterium]